MRNFQSGRIPVTHLWREWRLLDKLDRDIRNILLFVCLNMKNTDLEKQWWCWMRNRTNTLRVHRKRLSFPSSSSLSSLPSSLALALPFSLYISCVCSHLSHSLIIQYYIIVQRVFFFCHETNETNRIYRIHCVCVLLLLILQASVPCVCIGLHSNPVGLHLSVCQRLCIICTAYFPLFENTARLFFFLSLTISRVYIYIYTVCLSTSNTIHRFSLHGKFFTEYRTLHVDVLFVGWLARRRLKRNSQASHLFSIIRTDWVSCLELNVSQGKLCPVSI